MVQCHFDYMDESVPVSLNELGEELQQDWRGYMNMCCNALSKEVKEKSVYLFIRLYIYYAILYIIE